ERERVRSFAQTIQHWVFVSKHNHQLAQRQLAQQFHHAEVIVNAARLNLTKPLPWSSQEVPQLGCVARLETRWKGQDVLLEVLSQSQWRDRPWHLNLYGVGPDQDYIQQLIQYYHLSDRVTCHGYIRDIQSVWQQNHLMVMASRGEGTPLAVLEAMMCGRPTVTTDVGGNREILNDGETGFIAETATPYSFGNTLEKAWEERDCWSAMGSKAHEVAKQYAQANPAQQLLDYLVTIPTNS
ncbi:MAG: glycosyltransferase family 4 protein, partial [Moorea sp. SIO4G2]|nr:glycosyltransferase family 4 protein [Moorena sp. SIO4G2]